MYESGELQVIGTGLGGSSLVLSAMVHVTLKFEPTTFFDALSIS